MLRTGLAVDYFDYFISLLPLLLYAVWIYLWCHIFHRAGFNRWWGLTAILTVVPVIILAVSRWPIETQLGITRGEIDPTKETAYEIVDEGARLERQKQYEAALERYDRVIRDFPDSEPANDARIARDSILRRLDAEARQAGIEPDA